MRKGRICPLMVVGLLLLGSGSALATGFSIYEAGARATALGCAFAATADDGSALFYNPAGLSFQKGSGIDLNLVTVAPNFKFTGNLSKTDAEVSYGNSEDKTFLVPGTYYTNSNNEKLAWGVGLYAPFGLGVTWQDGASWVGRRVSHDATVETIYVTPAVSYMVAEGMAFSFGLDFARQSIKLKKYSPEPITGTNAIETTIEGDSSINITPVLSGMYRPSEKWSFGATYHFKKTMNYDEGDATLQPVAPGDDPFGNTLVAGVGGEDQKLSSELNLPDMLMLGAAYRFSERAALEFNYVWFGWSTFEKLDLTFENSALDQSLHFGYEDSYQLRLGLDVKASEKLNLMAGYVRDNTPQPTVSVSPLLPDSDRNDYSVGAMYSTGQWKFNFSYMAVIGEERTNIENGEPVRNTTDYPYGTYSSVANLFGFGVGYNF